MELEAAPRRPGRRRCRRSTRRPRSSAARAHRAEPPSSSAARPRRRRAALAGSGRDRRAPGRRPRSPGRRSRGARRSRVVEVSRRAPRETAASARIASRWLRRGATSRSTPARCLTPARDLVTSRAEGDLADRWGTGGEHVVEQPPTGELHHSATGDAMGGQGVAGQLGPVDQRDVVPPSREQVRGRGAGATGADDDHVVVADFRVLVHGHHRGRPTSVVLGDAVEETWRPAISASPRHRQLTTKDRGTPWTSVEP